MRERGPRGMARRSGRHRIIGLRSPAPEPNGRPDVPTRTGPCRASISTSFSVSLAALHRAAAPAATDRPEQAAGDVPAVAEKPAEGTRNDHAPAYRPTPCVPARWGLR